RQQAVGSGQWAVGNGSHPFPSQMGEVGRGLLLLLLLPRRPGASAQQRPGRRLLRLLWVPRVIREALTRVLFSTSSPAPRGVCAAATRVLSSTSSPAPRGVCAAATRVLSSTSSPVPPGRRRSRDPGYAFYDCFQRSTMHDRGMEENENE